MRRLIPLLAFLVAAPAFGYPVATYQPQAGCAATPCSAAGSPLFCTQGSVLYMCSAGSYVAVGSGGGGTPGGSNTQVQINSGGAFAGDSGLTFNTGTDALAVGGGITVAAGGATIVGTSSITGNTTIIGTLTGLTGLTVASGTVAIPAAQIDASEAVSSFAHDNESSTFTPVQHFAGGVGLVAGQKLYLEDSGGDSWLVRDGPSGCVQWFKDGALAGQMCDGYQVPNDCPVDSSGLPAGGVCLNTLTGDPMFKNANGLWPFAEGPIPGRVSELGTCAANQIRKENATATAWVCAADSTGGSPAFNDVTTGTNTAALHVGSGGALDATGTGTITATAVLLPAAANGLSSTTSSGSGLENLSVGVTMLQGCADGDLEKWDETLDKWKCAPDISAGAPSFATLTTGTNTDVTGLFIGTGGSLTATGTGVIRSTDVACGSGCVADAELASNYSGVGACGASQWATATNDNAAPTCSQPAFSDLSGQATDAQVSDTLTASSITQGASPSLTTAGQVGLDSTVNQMLWHIGGAVRVDSPVKEVCAMVPDLAATDDNFEFWMPPYAVTVTDAACHCRGTCAAALPSFQFTDRTGTAMTGTPTCSTGSTNSTFTALTGAATALAEGEGLRFNVTNSPLGTDGADEYTICVKYTIDRQ
jgi:hypothetical protein